MKWSWFWTTSSGRLVTFVGPGGQVCTRRGYTSRLAQELVDYLNSR